MTKPFGNRVLASLPRDVASRLNPHVKRLDLNLGHSVCEIGDKLDHAYFPETCVLSLLGVVADGTAIETAVIGAEGLYAVHNIYHPYSFARCLVQVAGVVIRIPLEHLLKEFSGNEDARRILMTYSAKLVAQVHQSVVCAALHSAEARLCRWLLAMQDRTGIDTLHFTHEFLAEILAANRTTVTLAARSLQQAGLIRYQRGKIKIVDRPGIEEATCECYAVLSQQFNARC